MGRKDAARFKKIEDQVALLTRNQIAIVENHERFIKASKEDWQDLRNFLTKMIEGN